MKNIRLCVTRYISGHPVFLDEKIGMRSDGLPKALGPMIPLITSMRPDSLRLVLTLLTLGRSMTLPVSPNYKTITQPITETRGLKAVISFIEENIDRVNWTSPVWDGFHLSTKSGPNGIATLSCLKDLHALTQEMRDDISTLTNGEIDEYLEYLEPDEIDSSFIHSRISLKADLEGKTRPFGIVDYWSQSALKPLHDAIFMALSKIPGDCTFTQASKWTEIASRPGPYYSFDLSAATDRFPLLIQKALIKALQGEEYAEAWARLLTSRDFRAPGGELLRYEVGQPMGAYSSWGAFSLTHHFVIWMAQERCSKADEVSGYLILGDDIVIRGTDVALAYKDIMTSIGVEISESKSHVSNNTFEFAKRWFHHGEEITPFPIHGIMETRKEYHLLMATLNQIEGRGWTACWSTDRPELLYSLFEILDSDQEERFRKKRKYLVNKSLRFLNMPVSTDSRLQVAVKAKAFLEMCGSDRQGQSTCFNRYKSAYEIFIEATDRASAQIIQKGITTLNENIGKLDAFVRKLGSGAHLSTADVREFHPLSLSLHRLLAERERTLSLFFKGIGEVSSTFYQTKSMDFQPTLPVKSLLRYPLVAIPDPFRITSDRVAARIQGTRDRKSVV